ncbi:hypothetical protein FHT87_005179 [Rhizobium sp. BK316]|uniref:hypothetical protein n=1 Tax=Rhizobium sp. BK316 TaxID=2587053 RepID=UPI0016098338|nr:hypothetical protein [Rhizobium sp. BK316]MBB3411226.1 hypothetical protein [Rhizobium sp. BK316]
MNLFLVIYMGVAIGGVAGPLPYDMKECESRRDVFRAKTQEVIDTGFSKAENRNVTAKELAALKTMRFECEYHQARPSLGVPA